MTGIRTDRTEEAERVAEIVKNLVVPGVTWVNSRGESKPLSLDDVLIVAPYNAQVSEIAERIPGARVGTVDKFQGQEAPVVIYSMATSSSRRSAARNGVPLQSQPAQRCDLAGAVPLHPRRQPRALRGGVPNAPADAHGECVLPVSRTRARDRRWRSEDRCDESGMNRTKEAGRS